ncbi:MAG: hypothetical protein QN183_13685 [Armatimonadota bacterium]|nr:hypothetical protein [Armatimonadota bacterium]
MAIMRADDVWIPVAEAARRLGRPTKWVYTAARRYRWPVRVEPVPMRLSTTGTVYLRTLMLVPWARAQQAAQQDAPRLRWRVGPVVTDTMRTEKAILDDIHACARQLRAHAWHRDIEARWDALWEELRAARARRNGHGGDNRWHTR